MAIDLTQLTVLDNVANGRKYCADLDWKLADAAYLWCVRNEYIKDGMATEAGRSVLASARKGSETPACDLCGDQPGDIHLRANCHLTAPLSATLEDGVLTLRCYVPECSRVVARFRVTGVLDGQSS